MAILTRLLDTTGCPRKLTVPKPPGHKRLNRHQLHHIYHHTYLEVVVDGNRKCRPPKDVPTNMSWFGVPTSWISIGSLTLWQVSRVGITTVRQHLVDIPDPGHQQHRGQWFIIATRIDRITNTVASPAKLTYMYLPMSLYTSRSGSVELLLLAPWQKMWSDYCR